MRLPCLPAPLLMLLACLPAGARTWPVREYGQARVVEARADSLTMPLEGAASRRLAVEATAALLTDRPRVGLSATAWSLALDNGLAVTLRSGHDDPSFDASDPYTEVTLLLGDSLLWRGRHGDGLFAQGRKGFNTVSLEMERGEGDSWRLWLAGGTKGLRPLWEGSVAMGEPSLAAVRPEGSRLEVGSFVAEHTPAVPVVAPEGLCGASRWTFFDRTNNPAVAAPGGRYELLMAPDGERPGELLLVYAGGAEVNAAAWQPGMVKGRMVPTTFVNTYRLIWTDATFEPFDDGATAYFDDNRSLLTLEFPLLESTLRFARSATPPPPCAADGATSW